MTNTNGIIATSLISGSRIPLFRRVSRAETQSDAGPAVNKPIRLPTNTAKLVNPTDCGGKLYGGAAKTWDWVRFRVRNDDALHETTKAANSTIGKANSFHGIQRSRIMLRSGEGLGWKRLNCFLAGEPLPRKGSRMAVAVLERSGVGAATSVSIFSMAIGFSPATGSLGSSEDCECGEGATARDSLGWARFHFVSGKPMRQARKMKACKATFSHQKFRQSLNSAITPAMTGPI